MKTSHIEILAPAGSYEALTSAINAGANAVYFGISDLNMRATAAVNFTEEDLIKIVKQCHKNNVKAYVTVNTLLYNNEIEKIHKLLDDIKKANADAVIAADMATIMYAREIGLEVHISTQLSISNTESVKFYSQFADRIVLARELTIEQVKQVCEDIKSYDIRGPRGNLVEIEVFAHGALCVAVSGRCAMSLYCYNTSANRGKCTQICRRRYKVTDIDTNQELEIDNNYVMSSSDLCTIGMLDKLVDAGVTVLKFEGRGRPAEYVDTVISTYKEALNALESEEYNQANIDKWNKNLNTVFNRGQSNGFYMGRRMDEWAGVHGSKATKEKFHIGEVVKYYPKPKVAEVLVQAKDELKKGDDVLIIGSETGTLRLKLGEFWVDDKPATIARQEDLLTFKVVQKVRKADKVYVSRERESLVPRGKEKMSLK